MSRCNNTGGGGGPLLTLTQTMLLAGTVQRVAPLTVHRLPTLSSREINVPAI